MMVTRLQAIAAAVIAASVLRASAHATQGIVPAKSRALAPGPASTFTGEVSVRPVVDARQSGNVTLGEVMFRRGARSHWHTHPVGQARYVTQGGGRTQREGSAVVRICKGDTAYVPAGVKLWHGATSTTAITHLSITGTVGDSNVDWTELVTDAQYRGGPTASR